MTISSSRGKALAVIVVGIMFLLGAGMFCPAEAREAEAKISPYEMDIKPLTTDQCGQCHFSIFSAIKSQGGRHQIDCVRCHTEYRIIPQRSVMRGWKISTSHYLNQDLANVWLAR